MIVKRALADADFGGDGIDADGANAAQIEQAVGGFEIRSFMSGFSDADIITQTCVIGP